MAQQYTGNAIPAPDFRLGDTSVDDEILASMVGYTQRGVTLAPGQGVVPGGCVIGQVTATKRYKVYASGNSDGSQDPSGVLRQTVDTDIDPNGPAQQGNILIMGVIRADALSGADNNAITALNGRKDTVQNIFVF